jgi:hypothetical protein
MYWKAYCKKRRVLLSTCAWLNWRPTDRIRSETTCNQTCEIVYVITTYCKVIYFIYSEGFVAKVAILNSSALHTSYNFRNKNDIRYKLLQEHI